MDERERGRDDGRGGGGGRGGEEEEEGLEEAEEIAAYSWAITSAFRSPWEATRRGLPGPRALTILRERAALFGEEEEEEEEEEKVMRSAMDSMKPSV